MEKEIEVYDVAAPISKGDIVGELRIVSDGQVIGKTNLLASEDVMNKTYRDFVDDIVSGW